MEPISLILGALLAGATKGVGEAAATVVKDAYAKLRDALQERFTNKPAAQNAIEEYATDPREWQPLVETYLKQADVASDREIMYAAETLMRAVDPEGARGGKYTVNLAGSQGVQVGDHNAQRNTF